MRFIPSRCFLVDRFARRLLATGALVISPALWAASPVPVHHQLSVRVEPSTHTLRVEDILSLPATARSPVRFWLGSDFTPQATGATLSRLDASADGRFRAWTMTPDAAGHIITLQYAGTIADKPRSPSHGMPLAWVDDTGVYLDGATGWVPRIAGDAVTFSMKVSGPADWTWISQGRRDVDGTRWTTSTPQDDIYLLGGHFDRQTLEHGDLTLETDLLQPDPALSRRYLSVMGGYLDFFSALIGPYPYPRFAVVENRWQTGYGMPGFTLLGSQVIRLPFILHSSLPHEILHNWWGNGVWVDASGGNWSEGLTAYLADHLIKEAAGGGADYRRKLLERYASFAAEGRDVALRDFRSRHSDATQAVGYGKMLMLYHMQRRRMGDAAFVAALRQLWKTRRFSAASMDEVAAALNPDGSSTAFAPLWLDAPGAPQIAIAGLDITPDPAGGQRLDLHLQQTQPGAAYPLSVPVTVQLADGSRDDINLDFTGKSARLQKHYASTPIRVDVDPHFDVFRRLDAAEQPASLARLFGAKTQWLVLPSKASEEELNAWRAFADTWQQRFGNVRSVLDSDMTKVPADAPQWILGWPNRALAGARDRLTADGQHFEGQSIRLGEHRFDPATSAVVLLDVDNRRTPLGFIGAATPTDIAGLARKLPHYTTYGRLAFTAGSLNRRLAEALPVSHSPLSRVLGSVDPGVPAELRAPLADQVKVALPAQR